MLLHSDSVHCDVGWEILSDREWVIGVEKWWMRKSFAMISDGAYGPILAGDEYRRLYHVMR